MKINRHNYEEYFILYADKELSNEESRMVEDFISLNPDLKDELEVYLNTVLLPEATIEFENKEELHHHDEALISYIDDELSVGEKLRLEGLINDSPKLQQELNLYRKTKLQPEADIVFENKSVLYRSTEKRRVVPIRFIRWAAAAAILLAVSITAINIFNKDPESSPLAQDQSTEVPVIKTPAQNIALTKDEKIIAIPEANTLTKEANETQTGIANTNEKQKSAITNNKKTVRIDEDKQKENIAAITQEPTSNNLATPEDLKSSGIASTEPVKKQNDVNAAQPDVTNLKADPYIYAGGPTNTNTFDPNEEGGENKKSRGLFRKLTRVFEKNTGIKATTDDDKLHIAAFTVKLK
jgi:hypothetical protein